jgi:hypothetical protein
LINFEKVPASTKTITDNLISLKLDIHVFGSRAKGFIYIDDMLTFEKGNMFLKLTYHDGHWIVNAISNTFDQVKYDKELAFEKQMFVN